MSDFHRIITSAPVNAQAARQMGRGEEWTPQRQFTEVLGLAPPEMRDEAFFREKSLQPDFKDLRGQKVGRLTVVGLTVKQYGDKRPRWVCRCACGFYVERKSKTIAQKLNDRCAQCEYVRLLRTGTNDRTGLNT